jgi:hypothetical protein
MFMLIIFIKQPATRLYRICHEKLAAIHIVKKIPTYYTTQRFTTIFTITHDWSLSWARWIQSTPYFSTIHLNIIISSMSNYPKLFLFQFSDWNFVCTSYLSHDIVHALLLQPVQFDRTYNIRQYFYSKKWAIAAVSHTKKRRHTHIFSYHFTHYV